MRTLTGALFGAILAWQAAVPTMAAWVWIEGEKPDINQMNRHPWWYDQIKREQLSGGDLISNFNQDKPGAAEYKFNAPSGGEYEFWVRANPVQATMLYRLNDEPEKEISFAEKREEANIAADGKIDLRFIAWVRVGRVSLRPGANTIQFRMTSKNHNHGFLDCFVFANEPFLPKGVLKPDQMAAEMARLAAESKGWLPFEPPPDTFKQSPIDLRFLNETQAGEHGFITVRDGQFVHGANGQPVRFWAVNGPPSGLKDRASLRKAARMLAKRGVNMVRLHGGVFNADGEADPARVQHIIDVVEEMKAEGIYSHLSIYFPLWLTPRADHPWLAGYNGKQHPFAVLMFNPQFQEKYRGWWRALLLTPGSMSGKRLVDEPAVFGAEIQNEDSFFFWTFNADNLPDAQLRIIEKQFGDWLAKRHGSIEKALEQWGGARLKRDAPAEGRVAFRPLWNMFNEKSRRDQDTARFLFEAQYEFYQTIYKFLRQLGFKGLITPSNWATASPEVFGPLEKWSYTAGDFLDRHGYFGCSHQGDNAAWSLRNGHSYVERSALRFEAENPAKPKQFVHPVMDPKYDNKPSMISETTFNRPNRYRSEAPVYYAAYGALQGSDAIVHFALDGINWSVKPNFWMQPWTLMSPAMMGQFPAAALVFRQGLVAPGLLLARIQLNTNELLQLKGTPLPQDAAFDELRLKDVPAGADVKPGQRIDPLIHYAGRTAVFFGGGPTQVQLEDLKPCINRTAQTITSSTGELQLDYKLGVLRINAPMAQGVSGALRAAGTVQLKDLNISSGLELGHIIAVPLDNQPLATSGKILLQAMSEEKAAEFQTEEQQGGRKRIVSIGHDPWQFRELQGTVQFKRPDAARLKVTALDLNGYPAGEMGTAGEIRLKPDTIYYLIAK